MKYDKIMSIILDIKTKYPANKINKILKEEYTSVYKEICKLTDNICTNDTPSILERIYIIEHNITNKEQLICPICNKNYRKFKYIGYTTTCSKVCHNKNPETTKKIKQTRIQHFGTYVSSEILAKKRKTCFEKYGVESFSKTKEFIEKSKNTKLQRYGSETYNNSEKMLSTKEKKYGSKSYNNIEKIRNTFKKKYGVFSPVQIPEVQKKQQETCLKKYGVKSFLSTKKCSIQSKKMSYEKMLKNEFDIPFFSLDDYIKNNDHIFKFKCRKCNNVFESIHYDGYHRSCPICYPITQSSGQKQLVDFLKKIISTVQINTRKVIIPQELDIYIPEKKLAIEFDGLYWHSECNKPIKDYHLNKTLDCEKQGIQLIHIFENEWLTKQDIVKSRLKNLLSIYNKTIYARKCQIKEIDSKISKEFQEENHIQGAVNSKVNLGLYYQDELISLMTFGKCRFDKHHEWELLRFCNKLGYHIPGAASKLLSYFEETYKPTSLVSYADRRWSQGKVYEKLGFKFSHSSAPNYWYWKNSELLESRVKYQKHKLKNLLENFDESKTEVENMKANGYNRIFDCGNLIFEKEYNI